MDHELHLMPAARSPPAAIFITAQSHRMNPNGLKISLAIGPVVGIKPMLQEIGIKPMLQQQLDQLDLWTLHAFKIYRRKSSRESSRMSIEQARRPFRLYAFEMAFRPENRSTHWNWPWCWNALDGSWRIGMSARNMFKEKWIFNNQNIYTVAKSPGASNSWWCEAAWVHTQGWGWWHAWAALVEKNHHHHGWCHLSFWTSDIVQHIGRITVYGMAHKTGTQIRCPNTLIIFVCMSFKSLSFKTPPYDFHPMVWLTCFHQEKPRHCSSGPHPFPGMAP